MQLTKNNTAVCSNQELNLENPEVKPDTKSEGFVPSEILNTIPLEKLAPVHGSDINADFLRIKNLAFAGFTAADGFEGTYFLREVVKDINSSEMWEDMKDRLQALLEVCDSIRTHVERTEGTIRGFFDYIDTVEDIMKNGVPEKSPDQTTEIQETLNKITEIMKSNTEKLADIRSEVDELKNDSSAE